MLQDLQIAVKWAKEKVDFFYGSKESKPERYQAASDRYREIKNKFEEAVQNFITEQVK